MNSNGNGHGSRLLTPFRISALRLLSKSVSALLIIRVFCIKAGPDVVKAFVDTDRAKTARAVVRKSIVAWYPTKKENKDSGGVWNNTIVVLVTSLCLLGYSRVAGRFCYAVPVDESRRLNHSHSLGQRTVRYVHGTTVLVQVLVL